MDGTQGPQSMSTKLQELHKQEGSNVLRQMDLDFSVNARA
jgi:hypothetical protein